LSELTAGEPSLAGSVLHGVVYAPTVAGNRSGGPLYRRRSPWQSSPVTTYTYAQSNTSRRNQ
jgi:hypothetical protein